MGSYALARAFYAVLILAVGSIGPLAPIACALAVWGAEFLVCLAHDCRRHAKRAVPPRLSWSSCRQALSDGNVSAPFAGSFGSVAAAVAMLSMIVSISLAPIAPLEILYAPEVFFPCAPLAIAGHLVTRWMELEREESFGAEAKRSELWLGKEGVANENVAWNAWGADARRL
jgi:hypothetical protein